MDFLQQLNVEEKVQKEYAKFCFDWFLECKQVNKFGV